MSVPLGVCFICKSTLEKSQVTVVKKRGTLSLIEASLKRDLKENQTFLQALDEVAVHDACRKRYTAESNIAASVRRGGDSVPEPSPSRLLRGSIELQNICFLCGDSITEEFIKLQKKLPQSRRNNVHQVESLSARATILEVANRRCDEWGQQIKDRLASVTDLVASDARYHTLCHKKLYSMPTTLRLKRDYSESTIIED